MASSRPIQAGHVPEYIKEKTLVAKLHPSAEIPYKDRKTDTYHDISFVSRTDNRAEDNTGEVNTYSTGIIIKPPAGYYYEVIASNDLYKHGYMLPGSVIIGPENTGELIVPLFKFKETEDIELPFRGARMILREILYAHIGTIVKDVAPQTVRDPFHTGKQRQSGAYIPDLQAGYVGDMGSYNAPGNSRARATPTSNHMF